MKTDKKCYETYHSHYAVNINILGLYKAFWYTGSAFTRYFNHNTPHTLMGAGMCSIVQLRIIICDHLSKKLTSMNIEKIEIKIIRKLSMPQRKNKQVFIEPVLEEGRLKLIKAMYHLICLLMGSSKSLFCSVAPVVCMSCAFVYNPVNKIVIVSSTKQP